MRARSGFAMLALFAALALAGCDRGTGARPAVDTPAGPGNPNAASSVQRGAPDSPPGGSSGEKGAAATAGSSGGSPVAGATGGGTAGAAPPPGTGTTGGMGAAGGMSSAPSTGQTGTPTSSAPHSGDVPPAGSANRTPAGSVGNR